MKDIILVGGGGHCKSCIEIIESDSSFAIKGIIDVKQNIGKIILGYPVIGCDDDIKAISKSCNNFLITVGQVKNFELRKNLYNYIKSIGAFLPSVVSKDSKVSRHAHINDGTVVLRGAFINADVKIGSNCIVNTLANIEHDTIVGSNCHISTGAVINGNCSIGDNVFIGSNSTISNNISICNEVVIGAGSCVVNSISTPGIYVGNPMRRIK